MSSLCLDVSLINDLCDVTAAFVDEVALIKYALSGKETFASYQRYIRRKITARFDYFKLDFYDDDCKLELSPFSLLPKMVLTIEMTARPVQPSVNCGQNAIPSNQALNILKGNKVLNTLNINTNCTVNERFLVNCLIQWPTIVNVACDVKPFIYTLRILQFEERIPILTRFRKLNLCDVSEYCVNFLVLCSSLMSIHSLELNLTRKCNNFFTLKLSKGPPLKSLILKLEVHTTELDYFGSMLTFYKKFRTLNYAIVRIHNTKLQSIDNFASIVKTFNDQIKAAAFKHEMRIHLINDYQCSPKRQINLKTMDANDIFNYVSNSFKMADPIMEYAEKVEAEGYKKYSRCVYRREFVYSKKVFFYDIVFKNPNFGNVNAVEC